MDAIDIYGYISNWSSNATNLEELEELELLELLLPPLVRLAASRVATRPSKTITNTQTLMAAYTLIAGTLWL